MKLKQKRSDSVAAAVMVGPIGLWLLFLVVVPLIYVLVMSFCGQDQWGNVAYTFTISNYQSLLDSKYLTIYLNSLKIAFITTLACIVFGYPFAYVISRTTHKCRNLFYMLVIIPFWTNSLIRVYGWRTLLGSTGWVNTALQAMGFISEPLDLLYTTGTTIFGMIYCLFPFMILPLYTAIEKLDTNLLEASADLGGRPFYTLFKVILPLTSGGIFSGSLMVFIPCLGYFFVSEILGGGNSDVIGNLIERQFLSANNWPLGSALAIVLIIVTLIMVKIYQSTGGDMDSLGV